ncbi:MAG: hypothetical protein V8T87_05465 [Victivallales bacterium]
MPDTENAKAVFYNRFGFAPPDTVKGIYYYNDLFLYITDPAYYLVCKAPPEVVEKIVKKLNLIKMNDLSAPSLISSVYWWDEELQKRSQGYFKEDEQKRCYYYLFYHEETKTLQYCEFYTEERLSACGSLNYGVCCLWFCCFPVAEILWTARFRIRKEVRNMFQKKFKFPVPESVKEIYYYPDTFRRNPKFCIACKASAETVEKIIAELKLVKDEEVRPLFLYGTPDWWSKKLEANAPYSRRDRKKRCVYAVWHDRETERFQYAEVKY